MEPILVGGHIGRPLLVGRVLAVVGLVTGLIVLSVNGPVGGMLALGATLALIALQVGIILKKRQQCWVTDTGSGFQIRDRHGQRSYDDDGIFGVDLEMKQVYSQGVLKGVRRTFRVKVEGEARPVSMSNFIKVTEPDPLQPLIQRIVQQYLENAVEALQEGAVVEGKDWSLSNSTLTIQSPPTRVEPVADLDSVAVFDSMVCVWKKGVSEAILKAPIRSPNAFLLQLLLERIIGERGTDEGSAAEGLGRVLFERKGSRSVGWGLGLAAVALGGGAFAAIAFLIATGAQPVNFLWPVLALAIGGLCLLGSITVLRSAFRCHERGVYRRSLLRDDQLRYEDVREFTYSATRQYYNGVYIGTALSMKLQPEPGTDSRAISFHSTVKNADESMDNLRDHIAQVVAGKMLDQLTRGSRVPWTLNLAFLPEGIEYRPGGFIGRKPVKLLRYEELFGFDIQDGTFHLWDRPDTKSIMRESAGAPNFYPGYLVLLNLIRQP